MKGRNRGQDEKSEGPDTGGITTTRGGHECPEII
jgi:hypothetical protein